MYQSALRSELAPLGLAWHVRRNGLGELRDVPKTILRAFSKRRTDIEAAMATRGFTSSKAAEKTALATRQRKPAGATPADLLRERWSEQLAEIELPDGHGGTRQASVDDLTAALGNDPAIPPGPEDTEAILRVLAGENGVSLDDWEIDEHLAPDTRAIPVTLLGSTFTRRDAICAVARAFDVTPDQALALTSRAPRPGQRRPGPRRSRLRAPTASGREAGRSCPPRAATGATPPPSSWPPNSASSARR